MTSKANICIRAIKDAIGEDKLTNDELMAVFETVQKTKKKLAAETGVDRLDDKLRDAIAEEAQQNKIFAALQRKHAAMNALIRDRRDAHLDSLISAGMVPEKALRTVFEGSQQGVANARWSVYATRQGFERKYIGEMLSELQRETPHVFKLVNDDALHRDIVREMSEFKEGGQPGRTNNADAIKVAKILAKYAEVSRVELNELGAMIGKLEGWGGPHRHDGIKVGEVTQEDWVAFIKNHLDSVKTFPDLTDVKDIDAALGTIWDEIITNTQRNPDPGAFRGPANLAKGMSKHRVLHFKDADAWLNYNDRFGSGNIIHAIVSHQQRAASHAAQMQMFGPNPRVMLDVLVEGLKERVRADPKMTAAQKRKQMENLNLEGGTKLADALTEMLGLTMSPTHTNAAKINQTVRDVGAMAKLGSAVLTAGPTDTLTTAVASMFRGSGFFKGLADNVRAFAESHTGGTKEMSYLLGEGFDGWTGAIATPHFASDGVPGHVHGMATKFFKYSGLTGWTDRMRAASSRIIAAEMGMRSGVSFNRLPDAYRHVLGLHGIDAAQWEVIRASRFTADNGNVYVTPDRVRDQPDTVFEPLIKDRLDEFTASLKAKKNRSVIIDRARARFINDARRDLDLAASRFIADEVNYAVVETDAASRRISLRGTRPGTAAGEAARYVVQFKGFPIAFSNRVLGRSAVGGRNLKDNFVHTGTLIAGMGVAGYMSLALKDSLKGRWPPRDPAEHPEVLLSAMLQGGALGIYGDFLFGEANRFGNAPLETLAGPAFSTAADVAGIFQNAIRGDISGAKNLNLILQNTPFMNLWYTRPVLDALILDSFRELASPGAARRKARRIRKDFGQEQHSLSELF